MLEPTEPTTKFDAELFSVNYPDKIQIVLDRSENGKIEIRCWKFGDDEPLDAVVFELPAITDCFNCGNRHGVDGLDDLGYCSECLRPFGPTPNRMASLCSTNL